MNKKSFLFLFPAMLLTSCYSPNSLSLPVSLVPEKSAHIKNDDIIVNLDKGPVKNSISFKLNFNYSKKFSIKYDVSEVQSMRVWLVEVAKSQNITNGISINSLSIPSSTFVFNVNNSTANITYTNVAPNTSEEYSYRIAIALYNQQNGDGVNITDTTQTNSIKINNSIDAAISNSGGETNEGYISVSSAYDVSSVSNLNIDAKVAN